MHALIENHCVIRVFETHISAVENGGTHENIIPVEKTVLFYLDGGAMILGELMEEYETFGVPSGNWVIMTDECSYQLSEVDFWQPIGAWLSF